MRPFLFPRIFNVVVCFFLLLGWLFQGCNKESTEPDQGQPPAPTPYQLSDFSSAETCKDCHPNHYDEWEGSMHAYSFLDPVNTLWFESLRNSLGAEALGQACVQCHSPIGSLTGSTPIGFNKEDVDPLVKEGINCDVCHLMVEASPTTFTDAEYHFDVKSGTRYGNISDPMPNTFHDSEYKLFYTQSSSCLPCHDFVNAQGLPAEITYTEWLNSPYAAMGVECQTCHMPTYTGRAAIGAPERENLHRHDFIGVDIALLDNFPDKTSQRQKVEELLQNAVTMQVSAPTTVDANSNLQLAVTIVNDKTGHDIPSSVTFVRQMWLRVTVTSGSDTLYKSGYFDANGDLMDANSLINPNGDPDLVLFQSSLYLNGEPANVVTADSITIRSIPAFASRTGRYEIPVNVPSGTTLNVSVQLLFRTFPPYALRGGGEDLIPKVPIFEMSTWESLVVVN